MNRQNTTSSDVRLSAVDDAVWHGNGTVAARPTGHYAPGMRRTNTALLAVIALAAVVVAAVITWTLVFRDSAPDVPADVYAYLTVAAETLCETEEPDSPAYDACFDKNLDELIKQWKAENN